MRENESARHVVDTQMLVSFLLCVMPSSAWKLDENKTKVIILVFKSYPPLQSHQLLN